MRIRKLYRSKKKNLPNHLGGKTKYKSLEPSRGGMGMRLNTPRPRFITANNTINLPRAGYKIKNLPGMILANTPQKAAVKKLPVTPAIETKAISLDGFLKYLVSIGTGFAHPNLKSKSIRAPMGSKCARGLRVSRPALMAVGSPNLNAT
jgi:hypothetical protein